MMVSKVVSKANTQPQLRLLALPICKKPELVYYCAQKRKDVKGKVPDTAAEYNATEGAAPPEAAATPESKDLATRATNLITGATNFAASKWEELGKVEKSNWKYKTYMRGEKLMDRIEYEEWLLKALDASTAPKLWSKRPKVSNGDTSSVSNETLAQSHESHVPLYFPPSLISESGLMNNFKGLLEYRESHHQSAMTKALLVAPLTLPFALVPVIPNFPLFYVLWRAWSHWKALKSSQYLKGLISHEQLETHESPILDELYAKRRKGQEKLTEVPSGTPQVLLTNEMVEELTQAFDLDQQAGVDIRRAIMQAEARLKALDKSS